MTAAGDSPGAASGVPSNGAPPAGSPPTDWTYGQAAALHQVGLLFAEFRKLSSGEDLLNRYAALLMQVGDWATKNFIELSEANRKLQQENALLAKMLVEVIVQMKCINVEALRAAEEGHTKRHGMDKISETLAKILMMIDPELVNELIRKYGFPEASP